MQLGRYDWAYTPRMATVYISYIDGQLLDSVIYTVTIELRKLLKKDVNENYKSFQVDINRLKNRQARLDISTHNWVIDDLFNPSKPLVTIHIPDKFWEQTYSHYMLNQL